MTMCSTMWAANRESASVPIPEYRSTASRANPVWKQKVRVTGHRLPRRSRRLPTTAASAYVPPVAATRVRKARPRGPSVDQSDMSVRTDIC
jgi:hypothetical protein